MQHYFDLMPDEQQEVLRAAENHLPYTAEAIEKDIWINSFEKYRPIWGYCPVETSYVLSPHIQANSLAAM